MAARESYLSCYGRMTGGEPGQTMDSPPRVLRRLRTVCPTCPHYLLCPAKALLIETDTPPASTSKHHHVCT